MSGASARRQHALHPRQACAQGLASETRSSPVADEEEIGLLINESQGREFVGTISGQRCFCSWSAASHSGSVTETPQSATKGKLWSSLELDHPLPSESSWPPGTVTAEYRRAVSVCGERRVDCGRVIRDSR
jgi:hypothetical protein